MASLNVAKRLALAIAIIVTLPAIAAYLSHKYHQEDHAIVPEAALTENLMASLKRLDSLNITKAVISAGGGTGSHRRYIAEIYPSQEDIVKVEGLLEITSYTSRIVLQTIQLKQQDGQWIIKVPNKKLARDTHPTVYIEAAEAALSNDSIIRIKTILNNRQAWETISPPAH